MNVKDEFRTNPLSHQPGGGVVRVGAGASSTSDEEEIPGKEAAYGCGVTGPEI